MPIRGIVPPEEPVTVVRNLSLWAVDTQQGESSNSTTPSVPSPPAPASDGREPLLFSPSQSNPDRERILDSFNRTPTYLFRLHTPHSAGTMATTEVGSQAHRRGFELPDLFQLSPEVAATFLACHLRWEHFPPVLQGSNLVSWSSSLLVVLQHGLHRYRTDLTGQMSLSDIQLLVLDTRKFPKGTFIQDLEAITDFSPHSGRLVALAGLRSSTVHYYGEFLSQGSLDVSGQSHQTSMQQLIDAGLFSLCPELEDPNQWEGWALPVLDIREKIRGPPRFTDKSEVRTAIAMAQACFGSRWALPLAVMLLSLQPRSPSEETILDGFTSMFGVGDFKALGFRKMKFDPESPRMAEMRLYQRMLRAIHSRFMDEKVAGTRGVAGLEDSFRQLSVGREPEW